MIDRLPSEPPRANISDVPFSFPIRALRTCMRNLHKYAEPGSDLPSQLTQALVQKYNNRTDKRSRYRPKNPDKKPLGEPTIRKINRDERRKLQEINHRIAA